mgnify:CR=1 FL=1
MKTMVNGIIRLGVMGLLSGSPVWSDLIWRVDFNGANNDTLPTSNFTGWAVSSTSRTQVFGNVDGGSVSSNITAVITGAGSQTLYQRNMSGGSETNLFRDGTQWNTSGGTLNLTLSGLSASFNYQVRLWAYDYQFGNSATQGYYDVTGGGNDYLGSLTNTINSVASGSPLLPNGLYDARYVLTANLTAGAGGELSINIIPGSGNQKINGFEVIGYDVVPEPSTMVMFGLAGGLMILRRRWLYRLLC